jgi:hypothetical protein
MLTEAKLAAGRMFSVLDARASGKATVTRRP